MRFVVCVDEAAECVTDKKPQQMFFDGDDTSAFTKEAFQFLQDFERERQTTEVMIKRFIELDLFESKEMFFQGNNADGSPAERQKIAVGNWQRLVNMTLRRTAKEQVS